MSLPVTPPFLSVSVLGVGEVGGRSRPPLFIEARARYGIFIGNRC
jgi:hypothetical protein